MKPKELTLRPFTDSDITLLERWLNKPYILQWYLDADSWLKELRQRQGAFRWLHHFIVMQEKTPVGFCQYYDCFDARAMEDRYHVAKRGETFSIDYLIGEEDFLGCGYGKGMVRILTDTVWQTERPKQIIVQPDMENLPSCRVLLANGYIFDELNGYYRYALNGS